MVAEESVEGKRGRGRLGGGGGKERRGFLHRFLAAVHHK